MLTVMVAVVAPADDWLNDELGVVVSGRDGLIMSKAAATINKIQAYFVPCKLKLGAYWTYISAPSQAEIIFFSSEESIRKSQ